MKIELSSLEQKRLPNFNGGEKEFLANMMLDEQNKILLGRLVPGASIGYHRHEETSEVIYILSGKGRAVCNTQESGVENGVEEQLGAGDCHYCPMGAFHTLINESAEDLVFFAVVGKH